MGKKRLDWSLRIVTVIAVAVLVALALILHPTEELTAFTILTVLGLLGTIVKTLFG